MKRLAVCTAAVAACGFAATPSPAMASILINAPTSASCGSSIVTGVWDRPDGLTQSRTVRIQVRSARGYVLWSKTVKATSSWRYFRYRGRCGRTYRVSYTNTQFGSETYKVRVRD